MGVDRERFADPLDRAHVDVRAVRRVGVGHEDLVVALPDTG